MCWVCLSLIVSVSSSDALLQTKVAKRHCPGLSSTYAVGLACSLSINLVFTQRVREATWSRISLEGLYRSAMFLHCYKYHVLVTTDDDSAADHLHSATADNAYFTYTWNLNTYQIIGRSSLKGLNRRLAVPNQQELFSISLTCHYLVRTVLYIKIDNHIMLSHIWRSDVCWIRACITSLVLLLLPFSCDSLYQV